MRRMTFKPALLLLIAAMLIIASGCGNSGKTNNTDAAKKPESTGQPESTVQPEATKKPESTEKAPVVTIEMSNGKTIKVELSPEIAPNTVNNFISLVKQGFYDGTIFHRIIPGFMVQGGDPDGTGMGGPGYGIAGEFSSNGFVNDLKHTRGVISMARSGMPDSAGSQFFIMVDDAASLDGAYASFGHVIEGMETVDEIVNQETGTTAETQERPANPLSMKKVTVDTFGVEYPEPTKAN
ncbi:MAG: peptidylprolyl isomerase [Candidatus Pristimantibacillus sp.]